MEGNEIEVKLLVSQVHLHCELTGDPQIDGGLRDYLERYNVTFTGWSNESLAGKQFITVALNPGVQTFEWFGGIVDAYYTSWGKSAKISRIS